MTKEEMINVIGGSVSGTLVNALVRVVNAALEVGRSLGSSIRRISSNNLCRY